MPTTATPASIGYTKGVPMGGDLSDAPQRQGADLPRRRAEGSRSAPISTAYQIIKGWLDDKGEMQEKVYDVVWCGRPQARRGRQGAAGRQHRRRRQRDMDQHDRRARTDRGLEGSGLRSQAAGLLLRPRASRSRRRAGRPTTPSASASKPLEGTTMTITERAYTSPIWYTPGEVTAEHAMKRLLREPLLHFVVLGAALFAGYWAINGRDSDRQDRQNWQDRIVVTTGQIDHLLTGFTRSWAATADRRGVERPGARLCARGSLLPRGESDGARP